MSALFLIKPSVCTPSVIIAAMSLLRGHPLFSALALKPYVWLLHDWAFHLAWAPTLQSGAPLYVNALLTLLSSITSTALPANTNGLLFLLRC